MGHDDIVMPLEHNNHNGMLQAGVNTKRIRHTDVHGIAAKRSRTGGGTSGGNSPV